MPIKTSIRPTVILMATNVSINNLGKGKIINATIATINTAKNRSLVRENNPPGSLVLPSSISFLFNVTIPDPLPIHGISARSIPQIDTEWNSRADKQHGINENLNA